MNMKFLLGAIVALVVSQSMQAIQVMFVNGNPTGKPVSIWLTALEANKPESEEKNIMTDLTFMQNKTFPLPDLSIVNLSIDYDNGTSYVVTSNDLLSNNVPTSGSHQIGIRIGSGGLLEIAVDNNGKVEMYAARAQ